MLRKVRCLEIVFEAILRLTKLPRGSVHVACPWILYGKQNLDSVHKHMEIEL